MAIPWLTVLKLVPWGEVINKAPVLADGAKKLWKTVAKKSPAAELADANPLAANAAETPLPTGRSPEAQAIAALHARLAAVEAAASDLHGQMLASSELLKAMAEQNTQLIKRIEVNRIRILGLAAVVLVLGIVLVLTLVR